MKMKKIRTSTAHCHFRAELREPSVCAVRRPNALLELIAALDHPAHFLPIAAQLQLKRFALHLSVTQLRTQVSNRLRPRRALNATRLERVL